MLEAKNISKIYSLGNKEILALDNVSFRINDGEFVAITGQSGSGKSTLMNILGCLDSASSGEYYIDGKRIDRLSSGRLCKIRSLKIGFVFQNFSLVPTLTAYENIELPLVYRGFSLKKRSERVNEALKSVGMLERRDHLPSQLSGGQMQRVAIARAVAGQPSVILADEPTGNLDRKNTEEVMSLLSSLNKDGKTIILVTHDSRVASRAERIIKLSDGKIDSDG
ncbi:MAG: ABC transporter ATP-binding protein [Ruminococcaceae bacterium]|nr:ABC transporter ATP-binding protein [Oscillospiraceae bacterium]